MSGFRKSKEALSIVVRRCPEHLTAHEMSRHFRGLGHLSNPYHWIIEPTGTVHLGRPKDWPVGFKHSGNAIGIALLGHDSVQPQSEALARLLSALEEEHPDIATEVE